MALIMHDSGKPFHKPEVLVMIQYRTMNGLVRMPRGNHQLLNQFIIPVLISFMSIAVFLYLSYVIIEGYSIVQLMKTGGDVSIVESS